MTPHERISHYRVAKALVVAVLVLIGVATRVTAAPQDPTEVGVSWQPVAEGDAVLGFGADDIIVPASFGTNDVDIATISWMRFFPVRSTDGDGYGFGGSGTIARHALGPDRRLFAEVGSGEVPNGAVVTQVVFYVRDNDAADITGHWCVFDVESSFGTGYNGSCTSIGSTSGTPGETVVFSDLGETVQRRFFDGSQFRVASYGLLFQPGAAINQLDIRMARVLWRREVSPAPSTATFNDVSPSHPFFQHIEALAASGITGGCGSGSYCPDAAVTRGQMAVFVAKALGLHWPAF